MDQVDMEQKILRNLRESVMEEMDFSSEISDEKLFARIDYALMRERRKRLLSIEERTRLRRRLFDSFRIVPGENDLRLFVSLWIDSGIALQDPGAKIQEKPDNPDTFLAEIWNSCFVCDLYSTVFCLPERISTAVILQIYLSGGDAGRWTDIGSWQSVSTGGGRCAL